MTTCILTFCFIITKYLGILETFFLFTLRMPVGNPANLGSSSFKTTSSLMVDFTSVNFWISFMISSLLASSGALIILSLHVSLFDSFAMIPRTEPLHLVLFLWSTNSKLSRSEKRSLTLISFWVLTFNTKLYLSSLKMLKRQISSLPIFKWLIMMSATKPKLKWVCSFPSMATKSIVTFGKRLFTMDAYCKGGVPGSWFSPILSTVRSPEDFWVFLMRLTSLFCNKNLVFHNLQIICHIIYRANQNTTALHECKQTPIATDLCITRGLL